MQAGSYLLLAINDGYITLPSGLIIQWGTIAASSGSEAIRTCNFPKSFPSARVFAFAVGTGANNARDAYFYGYPITPWSTSNQVKFSTWAAQSYKCIAIGY